MTELFRKIKADGAAFGIDALFARAGRITVAFSGGADSSLLLRYFVWLREQVKDFPEITAVHVNHMIRGAEADADEELCRRLCGEYGIPLQVTRADVPKMAEESGLGLEECARNVRYGVFRELRESFGDGLLIATAHNADDNLETVLFNLARGSGGVGLSGIPPVRDGYVVRPLLGITGDEIRQACLECKIPFAVDSTNADEAYTRNFIRHSIVPLMKKVNPQAAEASVRAGIALREDEDFIRGQAETVMAPFLTSDGDSMQVSRAMLSALPDAVLSRAVDIAASCLTPVACSGDQIRECRRIIRKNGGGVVSLPDGVTLEVTKDFVWLTRDTGKAEPFCFDITLPREGECVKYSCAEGGFDLFFSRNPQEPPEMDENIYKLSIITAVRFDTIYGRVYARQRLPGDTLFLGGHTRRLKKMISEAGIPRSRRDRLPVICDDEGVLFVPGLPVRGPAYARDEDHLSGNVIYVTYCLYRRF